LENNSAEKIIPERLLGSIIIKNFLGGWGFIFSNKIYIDRYSSNTLNITTPFV
jgi:hypothetical protein